MYDTQTCEIFVLRDMVFHEPIFPFHSKNASDHLIDIFSDLVLSKPALEDIPTLDDLLLSLRLHHHLLLK